MSNPMDQFSVLLLISALAVYALAFIAFALDLARRSADAQATEAGSSAAVTAVAASGGGTTLLAPPIESVPASRPKRRLPAGRVAVALTVLAWVLHLGADVLRGVAAGRVPWANMYEFSMTGTLIIVGLFLASLIRLKLQFLGVLITALVLVLLGISTVEYHVAVSPLSPPLQSYWLVIHVFVAILGTGFYTLGAAVSAVQLLQAWRNRALANGKSVKGLRLLTTMPSADSLENTAYRTIVVGFILWTFTLIAGAIWAEHAWGRYWGWDTKEVWTFIIWVIFAGYIHARATRGWRGERSAWLALIGYSAVLFNFGVVNVFFHGLHSYSGLPS